MTKAEDITWPSALSTAAFVVDPGLLKLRYFGSHLASPSQLSRAFIAQRSRPRSKFNFPRFVDTWKGLVTAAYKSQQVPSPIPPIRFT